MLALFVVAMDVSQLVVVGRDSNLTLVNDVFLNFIVHLLLSLVLGSSLTGGSAVALSLLIGLLGSDASKLLLFLLLNSILKRLTMVDSLLVNAFVDHLRSRGADH